MFSRWPNDEGEIFKFISAPCHQSETTQESKFLMNVDPSIYNSDFGAPNKPKQGRKMKSSGSDKIEDSPTDYRKRIIHRDIERQRRQEMAILYEKLRSLIPSEHLEGKRSISDRIHETAKYIRYQNKKIEELKNKREKLKKLLISTPTSSKVTEDQRSNGYEQPTITVKTCKEGLEITASGALKRDVPLSRLLNILISEGISIKSCISTRVDERMLHVIQSEVNEKKSVDEHELQKKLMERLHNQ